MFENRTTIVIFISFVCGFLTHVVTNIQWKLLCYGRGFIFLKVHRKLSSTSGANAKIKQF